jgi:hypothetical protein
MRKMRIASAISRPPPAAFVSHGAPPMYPLPSLQ